MAIIINIDVMLAKRKMSVTELADIEMIHYLSNSDTNALGTMALRNFMRVCSR